MTAGDRENKQPALSSKKGPNANYTKIAKSAVDILTASNSMIDKVKTARDTGGMIQPDEVLQLLNEQILPAIQQIQQGIEGGNTPVGGTGDRGMPGEGTPKPIDSGNEGDGSLDGDPEKKIASLQEEVNTLKAAALKNAKAELGKRYASLYPVPLRMAKEKEITDSEDDYNMLQAKVEGAEQVMKAAKDSGEFKRNNTIFGGASTYGNRYASAKTGEPIPAEYR